MITQEVFTTVMFYSKRARDYLALSLYIRYIIILYIIKYKKCFKFRVLCDIMTTNVDYKGVVSLEKSIDTYVGYRFMPYALRVQYVRF